MSRPAGLLGNALRSRLIRSANAGLSDSVVLAALASGDWRPDYDVPTVSDTAAVMVCGANGQRAVLKVATSSNGKESLRREAAMLVKLQADERLGDFRALVPELLATGEAGGGRYLVSSRMPGTDGSRATPDMTDWLTEATAGAIRPLHCLDAMTHDVDPPLLDRLVDEPIARLRAVVPRNDALDRLASALYSDLTGRRITLGWTHGDLAPGNVLITGRQLAGIIDWGNVREQDLTSLDLAFWLLTVARLGQPRELGGRVAARLRRSQPWLPAESRLLTRHAQGDSISGRTLLLLAWLRHVTDNLAKSERYGRSPVWSRLNVTPVLRLMHSYGDVPRSGRPSRLGEYR